jgi:glycosyltransferase involved in cell wall biosynthesis
MFLTEARPLTPISSGGGGALFYSHLELLAHSTHKIQISLVLLTEIGRTQGFEEFTREQPEIWNRVKNWCTSYRILYLEHQNPPSSRIKRFLFSLRDPIQSRFPLVHRGSLNKFSLVISEEQPDLIWAEHYLATAIAIQSNLGIPVVFSHHDWLSRLIALRASQVEPGQASGLFSSWVTLHKNTYIWQTQRIEAELARCAAGCVSGSITEAKELRQMGVPHVAYFPHTVFPTANSLHNATPTQVQIVHLGGLQGTASRLGLQRFLEICWPAIVANSPFPVELIHIGKTENIPEEVITLLEKAGVTFTGFVEDLSTVLRPYDIHIVPWEYNTGTRTRIPVALSYKQALVSTKAAASCLPELRNGEDCLLVDDLSEMTQAILTLLAADDLRQKISQAGYNTFLRNYTRESVQPRFDQFISELQSELPLKSKNGAP